VAVGTAVFVDVGNANWLIAQPVPPRIATTNPQRHAPTTRAKTPAMIQVCFESMKTSICVGEILSFLRLGAGRNSLQRIEVCIVRKKLFGSMCGENHYQLK
jgi:hypothetical protein